MRWGSNNAQSFDNPEEAWQWAKVLLDEGYDFSIYQTERKVYVSVIFTPE